MSEQVKQKSWFSRNWLWFVPVSGCLVIILIFALGIGSIVFGITKLISESEPYEYALEQAKTNAKVIKILGDPINTDGIMEGNISFKNNSGNADIKIPIQGPHGKARVIVEAFKQDGKWTYKQLYVEIKETKEQINLLDKSLEGI